MSWLLSLDPIFHQDEVTKTQSGVLFSPTLCEGYTPLRVAEQNVREHVI